MADDVTTAFGARMAVVKMDGTFKRLFEVTDQRLLVAGPCPSAIGGTRPIRACRMCQK